MSPRDDDSNTSMEQSQKASSASFRAAEVLADQHFGNKRFLFDDRMSALIS
jgi:hypothetical protein